MKDRCAFGQKTSPWLKLSADEGNILFKKELMYAGEFQQESGSSFEVDEMTFAHWTDTFRKMKANGVKVPLPKEHTEDPEMKRGEIVDMMVEPNAEGIPAIFGVVQFRDAATAEWASKSDVSVFSPPEFTDGKGNRYVRPITHVALTDYPIVPGLGEFEAVACSFVGPDDKEDAMSFLKLAEALGIECEAEDKAEEAIIASFQGNAKKFEELTSTTTKQAEEIEALKAKLKPADPVVVSASHKALLKDNRDMKLDNLVSQGKLSPAAKDKLAELFCTDDALTIVCSNSTNADPDNFSKVLSIFELNETVALSGSQTPPQGRTVQKDGKGDPNPLVEDMEARAKAAQN